MRDGSVGFLTASSNTTCARKENPGFTAWYLGPLLNFTWGDHFSANIGVDVPLRIANNGFQSVPDYRLHGGLSWRF